MPTTNWLTNAGFAIVPGEDVTNVPVTFNGVTTTYGSTLGLSDTVAGRRFAALGDSITANGGTLLAGLPGGYRTLAPQGYTTAATGIANGTVDIGNIEFRKVVGGT